MQRNGQGRQIASKVSLPLYRSGSLVGSALVTANSSWWTFGGDHPEDLLDTPFEAYAAALAGKANLNRGVLDSPDSVRAWSETAPSITACGSHPLSRHIGCAASSCLASLLYSLMSLTELTRRLPVPILK